MTARGAGPVSRSLAYVLDALVVAVAATACVAALGLVASVVGTGARDLARAVTAAYLVVLPGLFAFYNTVFWGLAGRTPGMAVLGLRVVGAGGGRVRWLPALIRALLLAYFPIGAAWMVVDRRHRAIHDLLTRTAVVRLAAPVRTQTMQIGRTL
ncbi:RDD family protein [Paractinoplanes rishiriensis]|uniref:RDD domain-containing protein n=1 Tax=Paractinoplanes rishiriensis TaxID=1050105 RepID=A0A919K082_9ACTN|nr:RDD family protein [Actinoplanes rishiriensis]GIE98491.1 hypothetical protein Ari01nite_59560 [Actinoplanes rishiriensis]